MADKEWLQRALDITRCNGETFRQISDFVAAEDPLEIFLDGESLTVTMRTPGDDFALASGYLYAESVIRTGGDIAAMGYFGRPSDPDLQNVLHVTLKSQVDTAGKARLQRNVLMSSSCGVCGKASLEAARCLALPLTSEIPPVPVRYLYGMNAQMRAAQQGFERCGGLHAAGLFDLQGRLLSLREDVGRHNAVDKLIGAEVMAGDMPLEQRILLVSGRTSFEIVQKAAMARIPMLCAVSAPSSLAVQLANELNMTLIGFLRGDTMNIYLRKQPSCLGEAAYKKRRMVSAIMARAGAALCGISGSGREADSVS